VKEARERDGILDIVTSDVKETFDKAPGLNFIH
jgi:hypothetical protein